MLGLSALGVLGAFEAGWMIGSRPPPIPVAPRGWGHTRPGPRPYPASFALPPHFLAPSIQRLPAPHGIITDIAGSGAAVALTIDDGNDSAVVAEYVKFCQDTGMRLTFFVTGSRQSWTDNAPAIQALLATGQVQLGNHSWSHPDFTLLGDSQIQAELQQNHDFMVATYGVDARPYFRPPYGRHNDRVDAAAAAIGYTVPVLWYGSLSDSTEISDGDLMSSATSWLLPEHIVIGHANYATVTRHFGEIADLIRGRGLVPVTLDDVFLRA